MILGSRFPSYPSSNKLVKFELKSARFFLISIKGNSGHSYLSDPPSGSFLLSISEPFVSAGGREWNFLKKK